MLDPSKLKQVKEVNRSEMVFSLARLPGTMRLFIGGSDFNVYDLDLAEEKPQAVAMSGHASYVSGVVRAGESIVSGGWDGKLIWWNAATHEQIRAIDAHQKWIRCVAVSPDGQRVASAGDDMVCRLWETASGNLVRELKGHEPVTPNHYPSMLFVCVFSRDGQFLATADKVGHVVVWNAATGEQSGSFEASGLYTWDPVQRRHSIGGARSLAFSPDGNLLAVGGMGKVNNIDHLEGKSRLEVYDWRKKERLVEWESDQFKGLVEHLEFGLDGNWLVGCGGDNGGFVFAYDVSGKQPIKQEKAPGHMNELELDESAETMFVVGNYRVLVWELKA